MKLLQTICGRVLLRFVGLFSFLLCVLGMSFVLSVCWIFGCLVSGFVELCSASVCFLFLLFYCFVRNSRELIKRL